MKPTDAQLEEAMALAIGWKYYPENREWVDKDGNPYWSRWPYPRYCTDRNALPEVWKAVRAEQGASYLFVEELGRLCSAPLHSYPAADEGCYSILCEDAMTFATAEPRLHVIAALKSLDKWPDGREV